MRIVCNSKLTYTDSNADVPSNVNVVDWQRQRQAEDRFGLFRGHKARVEQREGRAAESNYFVTH